jgi:8-oxo-dGTP pyrophosphatase MutT (NUDIX family)
MPGDERIVRLRAALAARPAREVSREAYHGEAAVALVIRPRAELELLLIRRAVRAGDPWSGHVAFPGGRRDARDADLAGTALREAEEETGIAIRHVGDLLGTLDEVEPGSHRLPRLIITPHVVAVPPEVEPTPFLAEVEHLRWAPLPALRDGGAATSVHVALADSTVKYPALNYEDYTVWGLTYRILQQFLSVIEEAAL